MFIYRLFIVATDVRVRVPDVYHTPDTPANCYLDLASGTSDVHFLHFAHTHTHTHTPTMCQAF